MVGGALTSVALGGLWVAIHEIPGFGPALADGVRSVLGPTAVAVAEDVAYGVADFVNVQTRADEAPKTFWEEPAALPALAPAAAGEAPLDPMQSAPPAFAPPFPKVAAEHDGRWFPMRAPWDAGPIAMYKAQVHPDPKRPFAAVAVVAMDLTQLDLALVAGTDEPKSQQVPRADRPGLVPAADQARLVAAFNGGFKAMHGNYGMRIGDKTFLPPRSIACSVAHLSGSAILIRTHSELGAAEHTATWYRQTPPCLIENGEPNPGLLHEYNKNWGATVGGETIIRRSALGVSKDGRYVFYALGDAVTAQSIGRAMQVVGSHGAAQLDVNHSYPRFLLFEQGASGVSATQPLIEDLKYNPGDYVGTASQRDFFYVTRKDARQSQNDANKPAG